jgi:flagellar biosynthesis protein
MNEPHEPASARPHAAVALRYAHGVDGAPSVVAKGRGELAARILALAAAHEVPVRQDRDLLEMLALCDLGEEIPSELYAAVASLLAYFVELNGELARG